MSQPPGSLPDPQEETFCRYVARGHSMSQAALCAGYGPIHALARRAAELMARPEIRARVDVLTAEHQAEEARRLNSMIASAEEIRAGALADGKISLVRQADRLLARLGPPIPVPAPARTDVAAPAPQVPPRSDEHAEKPLEAPVPQPGPDRRPDVRRHDLPDDHRAQIEAAMRAIRPAGGYLH
ncbi:MAG TPA: hypothetical protein VK943_13285 [Arenibaculum sp.]|nr:hypothetical protein [Arenibaculum sp.]